MKLENPFKLHFEYMQIRANFVKTQSKTFLKSWLISEIQNQYTNLINYRLLKNFCWPM